MAIIKMIPILGMVYYNRVIFSIIFLYFIQECFTFAGIHFCNN